MHFRVALETWPLPHPYRFGSYVWEELNVAVVTVSDGTHEGCAEAAGIYYQNDFPAGIPATLERIRDVLDRGIDRDALRTLLPPGGARNALDCALWDLESKRLGQPVWKLAGIQEPRPLICAYTLSADAPALMAAAAKGYAAEARALKLKLTGEPADAHRVRAVREARPEVWIGVDANQRLTRATLEQLLPVLVAANVSLIEQPLPVGQESALDGLSSPIPLAADESLRTRLDLPDLVGRFDMVNIKLDKCGGLTEALSIAAEARSAGLRLMVGNMLGTSRAMAPAFVLGQLCEVIDLDGPLLLGADVVPGVSYRDGAVWCPDEVWGSPRSRGGIRADSKS